jgi:hypothetical protein
MSSDATAIVFFGFRLPSLKVDEEELNEEWRKEFGPKEPEYKGDYKTPEWDGWRERLHAWEATPQNVAIGWCGDSGDQKFYVHCACFEQEVDWNFRRLELTPVTTEAHQWLNAFCDRFNLPKKEAGWHFGARYF